MKSKRIEHIINEIIDQYCYADSSERPWIIGFSGGKDSTVLLTLVWEALLRIRKMPTPFQLKRPVYVVCNDTLVENPIIVEYTERVLNKISKAAREHRITSYNVCYTKLLRIILKTSKFVIFKRVSLVEENIV